MKYCDDANTIPDIDKICPIVISVTPNPAFVDAIQNNGNASSRAILPMKISNMESNDPS
jgi:hypothetical protein